MARGCNRVSGSSKLAYRVSCCTIFVYLPLHCVRTNKRLPIPQGAWSMHRLAPHRIRWLWKKYDRSWTFAYFSTSRGHACTRVQPTGSRHRPPLSLSLSSLSLSLSLFFFLQHRRQSLTIGRTFSQFISTKRRPSTFSANTFYRPRAPSTNSSDDITRHFLQFFRVAEILEKIKARVVYNYYEYWATLLWSG